MKKGFWVLLISMMAFGLLPAPGPSAHAAEMEIRFATQNPTTAWIHPNGYVAWAKKMEEATEGRIKVTIYPAQTLGKGAEFYDLVKNGVADMAYGIPTVTPGQHPLTDIFSLPFLGFTSAAQAGKIQWEIFKKFPEFQKEYEGVKIISMPATGPYFIATVNKPVKTLQDIKGLKLRVPGGRPADSFQAVGGVPAMIPMPEVYIALEKGIIDGAPVPWEGPIGYLPLKAVKYFSIGWGLYNVPFFVAMNPIVWDRIPQKDQKAIMDVWGENGSIGFSKAVWDDSEETARKLLKENGVQIVNADPKDAKKWAQINEPINMKYINELEAKGLPAKQIYELTIKMIQESSK